ncbi:MAG: SDR family oxidoreductase [Bacteroidia bacterium]
MNLDLNDKHAIVCGSTQGIGKAIAMELASLGARITLVARDEKKLEEVKSELSKEKNQKHDFVVADFNLPDALKVKIEEHLWKSGPAHILINNTGGPPGGPIADASADEFLNAFNAHLLCNHILMQVVLEGMKEAKYGRIINIISTSVKQPLRGLGVSNTIRAAVANWSKTLSVELAPFGITVNNVLPGATKTQRLQSLIHNKSEKTNHTVSAITDEMLKEIPAGRFGEPAELSYAVAFLASPAAAYINGINLPVDGGRTGCL